MESDKLLTGGGDPSTLPSHIHRDSKPVENSEEKQQMKDQIEEENLSLDTDFFTQEANEQTEELRSIEPQYSQIDAAIEEDIPSAQQQKRENNTERAPNPNETNNTTWRQERRRNRRKYVDHTLEHYNKFFGNNKWTPFLKIKTERKMTALHLEDALMKIHKTKDMRYRRVTGNELEWLVEATTEAQSEAYLRLKQLGTTNVEVTKHESLNYRYGTVAIPQQAEKIDLEEDKACLLRLLKNRNPEVVDVEMYEIQSRKQTNYNNKTIQIAKIKFESNIVPQKIIILGENREVREQMPKPMQCKVCHRFGHTAKKCRSNATCVICSSEDHNSSWNCREERKCVNCKENHHAKTKTCTHYLYNAELCILQYKKGYTYPQARIEMRLKGFENPATKATFSETARGENRNPITTRERNKTNPGGSTESTNASIQTQNRYDILSENETESTDDTEDTIDFEDIENPSSKKVRKRKLADKIQKWIAKDKEEAKGKNERSVRKKLQPQKQARGEDKNEETTKFTFIQNETPTQNLATATHTSPETSPETGEETSQASTTDSTQTPASPRSHNTTQESDIDALPSPKPKRQLQIVMKHASNCGCHYCVHTEMSKLKDASTGQIIEAIKRITITKTAPTRHFDPIEACKCTTHIRTKLKDDAWVKKLAKEMKIKYNANQTSENEEEKEETHSIEKPRPKV